eukprot:3155500-Prymnesium_polylepis.1
MTAADSGGLIWLLDAPPRTAWAQWRACGRAPVYGAHLYALAGPCGPPALARADDRVASPSRAVTAVPPGSRRSGGRPAWPSRRRGDGCPSR